MVVVAPTRGVDHRFIRTRLTLDRQQGVHGARHGDQRLFDLARGLDGRNAIEHAGQDEPRKVIVVSKPCRVRRIGRIESLLPLTRGDLPELSVVTAPQGISAIHDIRRIPGRENVLRRLAGRIEARRHISGKIADGRRQVDQNVRAIGIDECPFPIHASVKQVRRLFERPPHLIAAVRSAHRVRPPRVMLVVHLSRLLRERSGSEHVLRPLREWLCRIVIVEVHPDGRARIEPAGQRVARRLRRGGERHEVKVEHAFVLRRVGVSFGENVVAPGPVPVVLAAGAGSASHDQFSVPGIGKAKHESRFLRGIVREPAFDLDSGHGRRRRRRAVGYDPAVGDGGESVDASKKPG